MALLPRNYMIGMVIFSLFIISGIALFIDFGVNDAQVNEFNSTTNKISEIQTTTTAIKESITNADTDFGVFGVLNSLINTAWNTLKTLFQFIDLTGTIFDDLGKFFGVPAWIISILLLIAIISLAFAIWSAIFQREL